MQCGLPGSCTSTDQGRFTAQRQSTKISALRKGVNLWQQKVKLAPLGECPFTLYLFRVGFGGKSPEEMAVIYPSSYQTETILTILDNISLCRFYK